MSVAHGWLYFIYPFPTRLVPDSLWWGSFPSGCEDSAELQSPRSGCLPHPACLRRCLAGTEQFFSAAGCYSGSLWTGRLDTCETNIWREKIHVQSSINGRTSSKKKNLAQDVCMLVLVEPVRLSVFLKNQFSLLSIFMLTEKDYRHMLDTRWLIQQCHWFWPIRNWKWIRVMCDIDKTL